MTLTIVTPTTYTTLAEAEEALRDAQASIGDRKLAVARIVKAIRADRLFVEHCSQKTGQSCASLDEYLADRAEDFRRLTGLGPRAIRSLLKTYLIFADELLFPEDLLIELGEHAVLLSGMAAMTRDLELEDDDRPTKTGGVFLGRDSFRLQVEALVPLVQERSWKVKDTKALVAETTGKATAEKGSWRAEAIQIGSDHARLQRLLWEDAGGALRTFVCDDLWLLTDLETFAKQGHVKIEGIEGLADAHCH